MLPSNNCGWFWGAETTGTLRRMRKSQHIEVKSYNLHRKIAEEFKKLDYDVKKQLPNNPPSNKKEILQIKELNDRLVIIEEKLYKEMSRQFETVQKRVEDKNDWLTDFELEVEISFWLGEDDPAYEEDDDNDIITLKDSFMLHDYENPKGWLLNDGFNHSEFPYWKEHPLSEQHHCWTLHSLYAHTDLCWSEVLRIKDIWIDIELISQIGFGK